MHFIIELFYHLWPVLEYARDDHGGMQLWYALYNITRQGLHHKINAVTTKAPHKQEYNTGIILSTDQNTLEHTY